MNNSCFSIIVRERACQNGVPVITDKVYSSINEMENISLNFGYTLTLSSFGAGDILVTFTNTSLNLELRFSITNPGIGIFDLPINGGTFRVTIISEETNCNNACLCNNCNTRSN